MGNSRKEYIELIAFAKKRNLKFEANKNLCRHHILPKSIFPLWRKRKSNLVVLTRDEHLRAHILLADIYDCIEMKVAKRYMSCEGVQNIQHSEFSKALWENSDYRRRVTEKNIEYWSKEENLEKHRQRMKEVVQGDVLEFLVNRNKTSFRQKVKNLETGKIFDYMGDAAKWAGLGPKSSPKIGECCRGYRKCAGKTPDGRKATWVYVGLTERTKKELEKNPPPNLRLA